MDTHPDASSSSMEAKQDVPSGLEERKDIKTGYLIHIDEDDYQAQHSRPMTQINLAKWPTTALLGLTLRLAGPIVIGTISQAARNFRHKSYIAGYLSREELLDFIYLATDLRSNKTHQLPAEEWIYGKLQPVPLHRIHSLVQGHIFDTMVWAQAARWHSIQKTTLTRTTPCFNEDKATKHPVANFTLREFHLGEWDAKDMFCLAMAIAGQALIGAIIQRGWDTNTFQHETWGLNGRNWRPSFTSLRNIGPIADTL